MNKNTSHRPGSNAPDFDRWRAVGLSTAPFSPGFEDEVSQAYAVGILGRPFPERNTNDAAFTAYRQGLRDGLSGITIGQINAPLYDGQPLGPELFSGPSNQWRRPIFGYSEGGVK